MRQRLFILTLLFSISLVGQKKDHGTVAELGSVQDYSGAGVTLPVKSGTTPPATCIALKEFFNDTDAVSGQRLLRCNSAGAGWDAVDGSSGGGGVTNHALLTNLDYNSAGHTGFESENHRTEHMHGGGDEVATATPGQNAIPKALSSGKLHRDWLPGMVGDTGSGGFPGAVPAPGPGQADECLKGDGTWGPCGSGNVPVANKGELVTHDGSAVTALAAGSNEQFLVVSDTESTGLKWRSIKTLVERVATPVDADRLGNTYSFNAVSVPTTQAARMSSGGSAGHALGFLTFADGTAPQHATFQTAVPAGWDNTSNVELLWRWTRDLGGTGTGVSFDISTACILDGGDITAPTYNTAQNLTPSVPLASRQKTNSISALDMTGCSQKNTIFIRITRDPTKLGDDFTGTANLYQLTLRFYVKALFQ
jgi:hypothetical protein